MKIFLNPGHCPGLDPGACGFGLQEADIAAKISSLVEQKLLSTGFTVNSLQSDDLGSIPGIANSWGADIFVSIHCNAFNGVAKGTETCIYRAGTEGARLGQCIQDKIIASLGTVDRGLKERPGLCVLRGTDMPAVLLELAFIDEANDNALLANKQEEFAQAITEGICEYIGITASVSNNVNVLNNTKKIAPNGQSYDQNDIDYLISQGYTLADALSFLDTTDKYSNSDMQAAAAYAESRVGTTGYGNNGCTEWVRQFLLKANHPFGQLMTDGTQGNLMWVPNIMSYAQEHGLWKQPEEGGALGDICLLETNYCKADGPDHIVIACGDGNYWGNSSSRNKIVKSSIAGDYGADNVWGYVATGSGASQTVIGRCNRSAAEIVGDAGSTSCVALAPNGMVYEENDIRYLVSEGYSVDDAITELSKAPKYNKTPEHIAPNGKPYEQNDIDYLVKHCGYTKDAAIAELSMADKYRR